MAVIVDIGGPRGTGRAQVKPNNRRPPGPLGNTVGLVVPDTAPAPHGDSAPPIEPTEAEKGWWGRWGGWVHTGLDVVGAIPVVGILGDTVNAGLYAAEGDYVNAGISGVSAAANLIPGGGAATKGAKLAVQGGKAAIKQAEKKAAEEAVKLAEKKAAAELAEKEAAEKATREAKAQKAREAKEQKKANGTGGGRDKGGPCDHLRQGKGNGPFRGGSHNKTSKPSNDGKDSHHMPADDVSPLSRRDGPAIQMDPMDHKATSSNGSSKEAIRYRQMIEDLLKNGKWRDAMVEEIKDIRELSKAAGTPKKYNEAMLEMLEYFKCLEKNKLLP